MNKNILYRIAALLIVLILALYSFGFPTSSDSHVWDCRGSYPAEERSSTGSVFVWEVTGNDNGTSRHGHGISAPSKNISHLAIEGSDAFTADDYIESDNPALDWLTPGENENSDPGIPGYVYSLKFDPPTGTTNTVIEFEGPKSPVWGVFFTINPKTSSKEAHGSSEGLGVSLNPFENDSFPLNSASNGSTGFHALIPDSNDHPERATQIPAPAAALLCILGAGLVKTLRRSRII